jgi:hypothetical protein
VSLHPDTGAICWRCDEPMTIREAMEAPAVGTGQYLCPRCVHPATGWNLYGSVLPGAKPFGYIAAGDTKHPYYSLVADLDRTPRPRDPRWHVVLRRLRAAAGDRRTA